VPLALLAAPPCDQNMRPRKVTSYDLLKRDWRPDVPGLLDVTVKDIRAMKLDELRAVGEARGAASVVARSVAFVKRTSSMLSSLDGRSTRRSRRL